MKKVFLGVSIIFLSLLAINSKAQCPSNLTPQAGSDWVMSTTFGLTIYPAGTVNLSSFQICNPVTASPAWTSNNFIGNFAAAYRPSTTRVFNCVGNGGGLTFQCTIHPNGDFYVKLVSGTYSSRGVVLGGSYAL